MQLKNKFLIGILGIVFASTGLVGAMAIYSQQTRLKDEIEQNHKQLAQQLGRLCEESLYQSDLVFFNFEETLKKERGYIFSAFVDKTGIVQIHSNPQKRNKRFETPDPSTTLPFSVPVQYAGEPVGDAHLVIDRADIDAFLKDSLLEDIKHIGLITLGVMFVSLFLSFFFAQHLVNPILRVISGMKAISKGERKPIAFPERKDEIGWMGKELNATIHKLQEIEEMKRDFIAGITHDLKSPLKGIQGIFDYLTANGKKMPESRFQEYMVSGQNNAARLLTLIDDLLLTARIEQKHEGVDLKLFDINHVIDEIIGTYQPAFQEKPIKLTSNHPKDALYVFADKNKTHQILLNLVSNGLKYTEKGTVHVQAEENGSTVSISVSDTGPGLDKNDKRKVFDKFYRSAQNKKDVKGTGLGLYITKEFIELQGGEIRVHDNKPNGTVFTFSLRKE